MENLDILRNLFDSKKISLINILLQNRNKEFYLREISKESDVPLTTTHRILKQLVDLKIVRQINISKFKVYQIEDNEQVMFLASMLKEKRKALQEFVNNGKAMKEVVRIMLHGEETESKANLLIIGDNLKTEEIKNLASDIKDRHDYTISYMPLTMDQYNHMRSVGLLPRQKRILYER